MTSQNVPIKNSRQGSFSFTFTIAGDYSYLCSIHPTWQAKSSSSREPV